MRFIQKNKQMPDCLEQLAKRYEAKICYEKLVKNKKNKACKELIQQQMLEEQQYLCAYCERKIENNPDVIHIEHIKPRLHYPEEVCDYNNLVISCNGNQCPDVNQADYPEDKIHSCGHHPAKGNYFDEAKFLNPVELANISDYFSYQIDEGRIVASEKEPTKANYMIELLNLDNPYLNDGRMNAKKALLKIVQKSSQNEAIKIFKQLLNLNPPPAFITFLRYYLRHSFNISD